ncbi:hypothetical protein LT330_003387 [Penicillium expansum]|nr:hypothetical protein LT330_003387 [Penicillium expansum]
MARVITDMRLNMSPRFEGPFWAAVGIDMTTNFGDQMAVLHLIREIYNPVLYDCLQKGGHWNTAFKGRKAFDIRRRLTTRRNEFPALVLAHVPDSADLTERLFDILRYYRFTDPTWRFVDPNYPTAEVFPLPAPAGGLAPRPPLAPAPAPAPMPVLPLAFTTAPDLHPAIPISRVPLRSGPPTAARARARARANAPARPLVRAPVPAPAPSPAPTPSPAPAPSPSPVPSPVASPLPIPTSPVHNSPITLIQPSIGLLPDLPPVIAPGVLHDPIPDSPQPGYYVPASTEVPSPPQNPDLDPFTRTMEHANRKRARDEGDEEEGMTSPPQKKRSIDPKLPKEKSEWTNFTTLSDSSSNDSRSLDVDGDLPMDKNYKPYKVQNTPVEPEPSVWSTMRDYLVGREPTPQEPDEEI